MSRPTVGWLWNLQLQKELISAQAMKKGMVLKSLGEKSCEIKGEINCNDVNVYKFNNGCFCIVETY